MQTDDKNLETDSNWPTLNDVPMKACRYDKVKSDSCNTDNTTKLCSETSLSNCPPSTTSFERQASQNLLSISQKNSNTIALTSGNLPPSSTKDYDIMSEVSAVQRSTNRRYFVDLPYDNHANTSVQQNLSSTSSVSSSSVVVLGVGRYGTVTKESNQSDSSSLFVAVKTAHGDLQSKASVQREYAILRRLHHPNIVHVLDSFGQTHAHKDRDKFVMECGEPLLPNGTKKLEPISVLSVAVELFSALQYLHDKKLLVHGDIKPANLVFKNNRILLIDFGQAHFFMEPALNLLCGTTSYTAPELIHSNNSLEGGVMLMKNDVYAAGCTLYALWSGKEPFSDASGAQQIIKIKKGFLKHHKLDGCPEQLRRVIEACTQIEAHKRPSAKEVLSTLLS